MSAAPQPDGGQPFTLPIAPAPQAVQLTSVAAGPGNPLMIINSGSDLAWVGGNSSVGPSNGVPLEPGTAVPWTGVGEVYAIADAAAAAAIPITITSAVLAWTPSPAAIAAEVAAELLAGGIPLVYTETLVTTVGLVPGGVSPMIDVHTYASLIISGIGASLAWYDQSGILLLGTDQAQGGPLRVPVRAYHLQLTSLGGVTSNFKVWGTNRLQTLPSTADNTEQGDRWSAGAQTLAAGTNYALGQQVSGVRLQGDIFATFAISGTAATGIFILTLASGLTFALCDTTQFHTDPNGARVFTMGFAIPASGYSLSFNCRGTGAAAVTLDVRLAGRY